MGILTESTVRLRDEIVALRQKRSLGQAELARVAAERRAGVGAMRMAFTRDRALAHRAWFGPTAGERRAEELQKQRRAAEEARVQAQAEQVRRLAEEARVQAQAERKRKLAEETAALAQAKQDRRLAEEASIRAQAEQDRKLAEEANVRVEETTAAPALPQAAAVPQAADSGSSDIHPATPQRKVSQHKASQHKASKRHGSK